MRIVFFLALLAGTALFVSCSNSEPTAENTEVAEAVVSANAANYTIAANTPIKWLGKKLTGEHFGTINTTEGSLMVEGDEVIGGQFKLDMNSITVLDLTDPGKNADLTDHLKSEDFFAVNTHPQGVFEITGVEALDATDAAGNTHMISGNLTLKGIVQGIRFPAMVEMNQDKIQAKANFTIDRTLWDIRYRSGKFFPELGDKVIDDQIGITLDLTATKA
jgi:polyisoprenoid-binding protein YceI